MATQTLDLKQSLHTKLSQRMQQAIHMLQLPHHELNALIHDYVIGNPFLEIHEFDDTDTPTAHDDTNSDEPNLWQDGDETVLEPIFSKKHHHTDDFNVIENVCETVDLKNYVEQQVYIHFSSSPDLPLALFFVDMLDDDGFLPLHINDIAKEEGFSQKAIEHTLKMLQTLEPVGVFSRSIPENLCIQLQDQGYTDPILNHIIQLLWPDKRAHTQSANQLTHISPTWIQHQLDITHDQWLHYLSILQRLPLRPGASFSHEHTLQTRIPDIMILEGPKNCFRAELNIHTLPKIYLNSAYYINLKRHTLSHDDKAFMHNKYTEAKWLLKSIHQRALNMLTVSECILIRQESFFKHSEGTLSPLTIKDIAEDSGLSESTVSRITQGKCMETPRGIFELKYFFTTHIKTSLSPHMKSARSIQHKIAEIIKREDPTAPVSDQKIVELLALEGVYVARRTVAKYRDVLGLGNVAMRSQSYKWQQRDGKILSF